jgi:hypothetical protein
MRFQGMTVFDQVRIDLIADAVQSYCPELKVYHHSFT